MSEKGPRGGGGSGGRGTGRGSGTSFGGGASSRNSHFKMVQSDNKYGMLLWQSKLQEQLVKEQKETARRRKSDEEQHYYPRSYKSFTGTGGRTSANGRGSGGGGGGGESGRRSSVSRSRQEGESSRGERHNNNNVEIPITMMAGPSIEESTQPTFVVTDMEASDINIGGTSALDAETVTSGAMGYAGSISGGGGGMMGTTSGRDEMGSVNQNHYYRTAINTPNNTTTGGGTRLSNNYQRDQPMFPKLVRTSKLGSSVSCDNLAKNAQQPFGNISIFGVKGGGAGAPRRSPSGKVLTILQGHPDIRYHQKDTRGFDQTLRYMMDKEKVAQYKQDLDHQIEEKQRWKRALGSPTGAGSGVGTTIKIMSSHDQLIDPYMGMEDPLSPSESGSGGRFSFSRNGMELAPLIRKYKSLPKLNTLSSTDVTKSFVSSPRRGDVYNLSPEPEEVARGLSMQLAEKHKIHQIHQENERLAAERHFNTWDSFWGRPGHGAPIFHSRNSPIGASNPSLFAPRVVHNKTDLFKAIHMTHQQQNKPNK